MWADRLSLVATGRTGGSTFSKFLTPLPLVVLPLLGRYAFRDLMFTSSPIAVMGNKPLPIKKPAYAFSSHRTHERAFGLYRMCVCSVTKII